MPLSTYTYSVTTDFTSAPGTVGTDRLSSEISASSIVTALDHISTNGDDCHVHFKASLSGGDETTLDGLVAAHNGTPLAEPPTRVDIGAPTDEYGTPKFIASHRSGAKTQLPTPNLCDRTTWWSSSQRHTGVALVTALGLQWELPTGPTTLVDVTHGKILHERKLRSSYAPKVYVNGVLKTEKDPHDNAGDYTVDYLTGEVTFTASQAGATVTMDYSRVVNSVWRMTPDEGKRLRLISAELQYGVSSRMRDTVILSIKADVAKFPALAPYWNANGGPYPAGTMIELGNTVYQTVMDIVGEANLAYPVIHKHATSTHWRDLPDDVRIFSWDYVRQATFDISSAKGMVLEMRLEHDIPMEGTVAMVTFYAIPEDDV